MSEKDRYKKNIIPLFLRKGGVGLNTKVAGSLYLNEDIKELLFTEENVLILYSENNNYLCVTDIRVLYRNENNEDSIEYEKIENVKPAYTEEFKKGVRKMENFTTIKLVTMDKKEHLLIIESGAPYFGMLRILNFITR